MAHIDDMVLPLECAKCNEKTRLSLGALQEMDVVTCGACRSPLAFDIAQLKKARQRAETIFAEFLENLKKQPSFQRAASQPNSIISG
jgi:hypothetical protein